MNTRLQRIAASTVLAIVAGPLLVASSFAAPVAQAFEKSDAALVNAVKDALGSSLGKDAADVAVTAHHGKVTLHGWVNMPKQETQARMVATKVPGVKKAYSDLHTWSSRDDE